MATMFVTITDEKGTTLGMFSLPEKEFKTGSRGYFTSGKFEREGKRYQAQFQAVEIGSKNQPPAPVAKPAKPAPVAKPAKRVQK